MTFNLFEPLTFRQPFSYDSPLSMNESITIMSTNVKKSFLSTGFKESLVGKVSTDQVKIYHYPGARLTGTPAFPEFKGKFVEQNGITTLKGEFVLQTGSRNMFYGSMIGNIIFWICIGIRDLNSSSQPKEYLVLCAAPIACAVFLMFYLHLAWGTGKKDIDYLQNAIGNILTKGSI